MPSLARSKHQRSFLARIVPNRATPDASDPKAAVGFEPGHVLEILRRRRRCGCPLERPGIPGIVPRACAKDQAGDQS